LQRHKAQEHREAPQQVEGVAAVEPRPRVRARAAGAVVGGRAEAAAAGRHPPHEEVAAPPDPQREEGDDVQERVEGHEQAQHHDAL